MTTIVTRAGKGAALSFAEGDANFVNLNTDKLESVQQDTAPQLGGNLNVGTFSIQSPVDSNIVLEPTGTGKIVLAGLEWPGATASESGSTGGSTGGSTEVSQTFVVTVVNEGQGNIYQIDGVSKPILYLVTGGVYTFDQSDASNVNHPLAFRDSGDQSWTEGVEVFGGARGQPGAQTVFTVPENAPESLKYYCTVHGNFMGNDIVITVVPAVGTGPTGTVLAIDDVRIPNTLTLSDPQQLPGDLSGATVVFTGTDTTAVGLQENFAYTIQAFIDGDKIEISEGAGALGNLNAGQGGPYDINYAITFAGAPSGPSGTGTITEGSVLTYVTGTLQWQLPPGGGAPPPANLNSLTDVNAPAPQNGDLLVYNNAFNQWESQAPAGGGGTFTLNQDPNPQLGGNLDVNNNSIVSQNDGNIVLSPAGVGKTVANRLNYNEAIHDLGTVSGTITPDVANGNVQKITLNGNLTLNAFTSPVAGQSVTLIINTNGTGRTLTSSWLFAGGEKTLSTTNTTDIISVFFDGTDYYASLSKGFA